MEDGRLNQRILHLEQLLVSRVSSHQNSSVQFATVLVANLMIINSGALFAFASMIDKLSQPDPLRYAVWAAGSFVLGIFLATLCGYAAYHNFMAIAQYEAFQGNESVFDEKFPDVDSGLPDVDKWRTEVQAGQKYYAKIVNLTLWLGNIAGIFSLFAFIYGCYSLSFVVFK
jgi:hypothetical protein